MALIEYGTPGLAGVKSLQYLGGGDGLPDLGAIPEPKVLATAAIAGLLAYYVAAKTYKLVAFGAAAFISYKVLSR